MHTRFRANSVLLLLVLLLLQSLILAQSATDTAPKDAASQKAAPQDSAQKEATSKDSVARTGAAAPSAVSPQKGFDYSKEAVVIERFVERVTYEADGKGEQSTEMAVHMQSEAGVHNFAVLTFAYTSADETVEVVYVRVRKPDGTVVATPEYNIQDLPADITRDAPMYSDIHEKHVTVKALGVGDTLEYLVRYHIIKPEVPGQFWFAYNFFTETITKDEELEINVPRDKYVKVSSPDLAPQTKDEGTRRIYTWKRSHLERKEPAKASLAASLQQLESRPSVQMTTFHDWAEVGSWYGGLQRPQQAITPDIKRKAADLTKGLTSDDDKIRALYNFVSTHFHYISLSFGIGRYQPHPADDVLGNEYGDCKDKHTLLGALLEAAGYEAWPALIRSGRKIDPDLPSPGQFDHVITVVPRGSNLLWLDTTPEVAPFGLLMPTLRDKQALVIPPEKPASLMKTPENPPFAGSETFDAETKLAADGTLTGHIKQVLRGDSEVVLRLDFRRQSQAEWKELAQRISYRLGFGGDVSEVNASAPDDTANPFQLEYDYTRKDYSGWKDRQITPPLPPLGIEVWKYEEEKPRQPILLGAPGKLEFRAKVVLPVEALHIPQDVNLVEDYAEYHSTYTVDKGVYTAVREFTIKKKVPVEEWDRFRKFADAISDDENRTLQLEGTTAKDYSSAEPNADIDQKFQEAASAMQRGDKERALAGIQEVLKLDPSYPHAHMVLGLIYMMQNKGEAGRAEIRKEEELHPSDTRPYEMLAMMLMSEHRNEEAMDQLRKLLKVDPKNQRAIDDLISLLTQAHKYQEAVDVLQTALEQTPASTNLQFALGFALIRNGQKEKGLEMVQKVVAAGPADAMLLNNTAYSLAEANVALDQAKEYGEKSLHQLEEACNKAGATDNEMLKATYNMSLIWDTVGWIDFRRGDVDAAAAYLRAAWNLSQDGVVADHLAQVYENQGKKMEAAHLYELALATQHGNKNEIRKHYEQLMGKALPQIPTSGGELSSMRTVKLHVAHPVLGNAVFSLIVSPAGVEEVKYVSGSKELQPMAALVKTAKFDVEFPNPTPLKLERQGLLECSAISGCSLVLMTPDSVLGQQNIPE